MTRASGSIGSYIMQTRNCKNCGTERFNVTAKGLCKRCYSISRRIDQIKKWDPDDETSLKGYPRHFPFGPDDVPRMKADVIEQLKDHLEKLRLAEERLRGLISSMEIEGQLKVLAHLASARNAQSIMHQASISFDGFTPEQRTTVFYWLYRIEENVNRRGLIHWSRYILK
jgi:hypothetical protein